MKLYFDHILGKQQEQDFVFSLVCATFEEHEWDSAFETGWAPAQLWFDSTFAQNKIVWYQSRQTRLVLSSYAPNAKTKKLSKQISYSISKELKHSVDEIYKVYIKYCDYKNFGDLIPRDKFDTYFTGNNYYIYFYDKNELAAITKLSLWSNSLFSELFWWNYETPSLSLGKVSFYLEAELAKSLSIPYLYMGISYNKASIYKSNKKGFEFWTGRQWLSDAKLFQYLCEKDDVISTIDELHDYQYEYLKLLKV
jgi:hypothetical protein